MRIELAAAEYSENLEGFRDVKQSYIDIAYKTQSVLWLRLKYLKLQFDQCRNCKCEAVRLLLQATEQERLKQFIAVTR